VPNDGRNLGKLLDRVANLLIQHAPVGHDDDGVEDARSSGGLYSFFSFQVSELVSQPGDGVAFAAARRVLDEIAMTDALFPGGGEELAHDVELVVAREDLGSQTSLALLPAGLLILPFDDLGVVFEDVGEALAGKHFFPEIGGFEAVGIGRIARAVVPAFVEGQEPRGFALQVGTHPHFLVIHGKVDDAAPELEQQLAGIAVALVLLDGVLDGLLGEVVF